MGSGYEGDDYPVFFHECFIYASHAFPGFDVSELSDLPK